MQIKKPFPINFSSTALYISILVAYLCLALFFVNLHLWYLQSWQHYLGSLMQHLYSATVHVNTDFQGSSMNISRAFEIVVRHFPSGRKPFLSVCCLSKMFGSKIFQLYFPSFGKLASVVMFFNYKFVEIMTRCLNLSCFNVIPAELGTLKDKLKALPAIEQCYAHSWH